MNRWATADSPDLIVEFGELLDPLDSRFARDEAAALVEGGEVLLEVDVCPRAAGLAGLVDGPPDEIRADATSTLIRSDGDIEQEGVVISVPRDVRKADEPVIAPGGYPPEVEGSGAAPAVRPAGFIERTAWRSFTSASGTDSFHR